MHYLYKISYVHTIEETVFPFMNAADPLSTATI